MSSLDDDFRASIAEDYEVFDRKVTLIVEHTISDDTPDFTTGQVIKSKQDYTVEDCIFRSIADRDIQTIQQLSGRGISVQKDSFGKVDTAIEIPTISGVVVSLGDTIVDPRTNRRWQVTALDECTLQTRYRVGVAVLS